MLRSVFKASLTALAAVALSTSAQAQTAPYTYAPPPSLFAPADKQQAPVPIIFQWTSVSPVGNPYGVIIQGRTRSAPLATVPTINYELQILDGPSSGATVLFDVITTAPRYVFFNRNVPNSGFTSNVPAGIALSGGDYWWRVRAISAGPAAPFSQVLQFALKTNATGTQIRDLAVEDVRLASDQPRVDDGTLIFAKIMNAGTFATEPTVVHVSVGGTPIAEGSVQQLNPNESVSIAVPWTPGRAGYNTIQVRLDTVGDKPADSSRTLESFVRQRAVYRTGMSGTLQKRDDRYVLLDAKQRAVALVTVAAGAHVDLASFVGRTVTITGRLLTSSTGFTLQAERVGAAQP